MRTTLNRFDDQQFTSILRDSDKPLIAVVWADWCGTCQIVDPILEELSKELENQVELSIIDYELSPMIIREFGIGTLPTFLFFMNGKLITRIVGMISRKELREKILELYNTDLI